MNDDRKFYLFIVTTVLFWCCVVVVSDQLRPRVAALEPICTIQMRGGAMSCTCSPCSPPTCPICAPALEVQFSPGPECREIVVRLLDGARRSVRVQAYRLTSRPIRKALERAAARGISVEVLVDRQEHEFAELESGQLVHVRIDPRHKIAHDKVVIVDDETTFTGSFNFSSSAEHNAENCLVVREPAAVRRYVEHWREHAAHAEGL